MSLGWNTESALMPSKAKKIEAPKGSMAGLKSQVFKTSLDAAAQASGGGRKYARGTATARRGGADDLDNAGRKRPKLARKREAAAPRDAEEDEREALSRRKLAAKAQLYEDLRAGEARAPAELLDHGGGTRWAWSRGDAAPAPGGGTVKEMLEVAARRAAPPAEDAPAPVDGGVKSQWEKTLHRSAKGHLDEIHAEAEKERAAAPARAAARDARVKGLLALRARLAARDDDDDGAA
ncbi:hypothetical protein JL720_5115 [Aureococcus anophagefferens]|nr:hypothetical protein JL720_5115 [Aureococcus anophagefferens]